MPVVCARVSVGKSGGRGCGCKSCGGVVRLGREGNESASRRRDSPTPVPARASEELAAGRMGFLSGGLVWCAVAGGSGPGRLDVLS